MKDEIIAGLRNALERGETLERAAQSFVNAGYNPQEVKAAVNELSEGVSGMLGKVTEHDSQEVPQAPSSPEEKNSLPQQIPKPVIVKKGGGRKAVIITLIVLLSLIFLGSLGYIVYYFLT